MMLDTDHPAALKEIRTFPSLVRYLRDEMGWPIDREDFEELTFEYRRISARVWTLEENTNLAS